MTDYKNEIENLAKWLRESVENSGGKGVVFGLSGGIDSAVVGGIAKLAFPKNSLGLMMPCHSMDEDLEDGRLVAEAIDLDTQIVDLSLAYDSIIKEASIDGTKIAKSNIKPRLRSTCLYYYGQTLGYFTLGGTNKSEYFIGYFTKFGDTAVDIMPIAQYTKREVYEMAKLFGIPDKIIDKKPSAGLYTGQTDEDELGFTYSYLDSKIENGQWEENAIDQKILNMHKRSKHKYDMPLVYERG